MTKTPKVVFAAIVLVGLPFAVWAGWSLAGGASAPATAPPGAGGIGSAPSGDKPARVQVTLPMSPTGSPTATSTATTTATPPSAPPTGTANPSPSQSPTSAPEATLEPTLQPSEPPTPSTPPSP